MRNNKVFIIIILFALLCSDTIKVYSKNTVQDVLQIEKHILVDSVEDADEMYKYIEVWDNAAKDVTDDYPYQIKFIAKNSVNADTVYKILSKYDYNYLFSLGLTHNFTIDNLRFYFSSIGFDFKKYNWTSRQEIDEFKEGDDFPSTHYKWTFKDQYNRFNGKASGYVNLIKRFLSSKNSEYFVTGLNGVEYDTYEFKLNTVAAQFNYCNEEKEYMLRLNNKEDFDTLLNELTNIKEIFVKHTKSISDDGLEPIITENEYNKLRETQKYFTGRVYINAHVGHSYKWIYGSVIEDIDNSYRFIEWDNKEKNSFGRIYADNPNDPRINSGPIVEKLMWFSNNKGIMFELQDEKVPLSVVERINTYPEYIEEICEGKIIYRVYNFNTGEHLFTSSRAEYDKLVYQHNWYPEGATCIINFDDENKEKPVYRIYNPNAKGGDHHYTTSKQEAEKCVKKGWKWDNKGKPIFYSGGEKSLYRLYNKNDGRHHYTPNTGEKNKLEKLGWKSEGKAWNASETLS